MVVTIRVECWAICPGMVLCDSEFRLVALTAKSLVAIVLEELQDIVIKL